MLNSTVARNAALISGFALGCLFLWLTVREVNWAETAIAFADAEIVYVAPMLMALTCFYWLRAVRWRHLLSPIVDISAARLAPSLMVGTAGNSFLPVHLGELVRVYLASREFQVPATTLLVTLVLERVMDVLSIVLLLLAVLIAGGADEELALATYLLAAVGLGAVTLTALFIVFESGFMRFVNRLAGRLPEGLGDSLLQQTEQAARGLAIVRAGHMYFRLALNSLVQWCLMASCVHFSLLAFEISAPMHTAFYILGLVVAGLSLPTMPGFVGTIQFFFLLGLRPLGIDASVAFGASVYYHVVVWSAATLTGLLFARRYGFKWKQTGQLKS